MIKIDLLPTILIITGLLLIVIGLFWIIGNRFGLNFGSLPGDIKIEKKNFTFYFPITTAIILSIILSLLMWIILKLVR
jgi:hypothetical protein